MNKTKYVKEIVKMQRPIASTGAAEILIYNEDRTFEVFTPADESVDMQVFGDRYKVYWSVMIPVEGDLEANIEFLEEVEEQDW